ncbi:MAG: efflux RND transporter periplasmic adaptor subunit [Succinatimonas sp.]|nr:efflux RND transporter periplasmic adaptor subunit [Succinatimonas sp.]
MSLFKKKLIVPCALALALSLSACEKQQAAPQQTAMPVDVFEVSTLDVPVISHLTGRANATRKAEVRPQVSGILQKRLFTEGSTIKQGDQLYQIDPAVYEANVASAQASLSSAKATEHSAKLKASRYASLLEKRAVSKQDYDDAQAAYLTAKASVESAQAALRTANINLAYTKVYAPISGTISRSNITEGALVSAGQTTAMTTIQQLDPIYVDLGQTVEDHMQLRKKMAEGKLQSKDGKPTVDIFFADGSRYPLQGALEFAEISVDESTGMVNVRALVPNPDHVILPGMFLRGDINEGVTPNATIIIASGVQREANGVTYVYAVNEQNTVERINVTLGTQFENYYVVTDGLAPGAKVITSNIQKIRTGASVQIATTTTADKNATATKQ